MLQERQKATSRKAFKRFHEAPPAKPVRRQRAEKPLYLADALTFDPAHDDVVHLTTQSWTNRTAPNGEPLVYEVRIHRATGAVTCSCEGFQTTITRRARKAHQTPQVNTPHLHCCHAAKAVQCCREWGYVATNNPAELIQIENLTSIALDAGDTLDDGAPYSTPCCAECGDELTLLGSAYYCLLCGTFSDVKAKSR